MGQKNWRNLIWKGYDWKNWIGCMSNAFLWIILKNEWNSNKFDRMNIDRCKWQILNAIFILEIEYFWWEFFQKKRSNNHFFIISLDIFALTLETHTILTIHKDKKKFFVASYDNIYREYVKRKRKIMKGNYFD